MFCPKVMYLFVFLVHYLASVTAFELWSSNPADSFLVLQQGYPLGNGKLGVIPHGPPGNEKLNFNVDSLWSGGPFLWSNYTGGNPTHPKDQYLPSIREWIFQNGTGNVTQLLSTPYDGYGSYRVLANMTVAIEGVSSATSYRRSIDLGTGVHTTKFTGNDKKTYTSTVYCSHPAQVCVYVLESDQSMSEITLGLENTFVGSDLQTISCGSDYVRMQGVTQKGPPLGMNYEAIASVMSSGSYMSMSCTKGANATLKIKPGASTRSLTFLLAGGTDYDQKHGNARYNYSFRGAEPGPAVQKAIQSAGKDESAIRKAAITDYSELASQFSFMPNAANDASYTQTETADLILGYPLDTGNAYVDALLFEYGRHMLISSSRDGLPTNLLGMWEETLSAPWSADYHADINIQMNYWPADQTGLGGLNQPLWDYIQDTWVPRGTETAQLLYGAPGWVVHDEVNIFGHTGMKYDATWADYPAAAAWLMQHVFDHYDFSRDSAWLQRQGYPLLKGIAQFWLSQLQEDGYFKDGTLVVNPCNSPEHGVFTSILQTAPVANDHDEAFLSNVSKTLPRLDKGLHIGTWGEIKEWKLPDSFGYDFENDTHRHLSHLIGWHPGFAISALEDGYTNATIQSAVATSLYSRGNGTGPDADAGWEKVWRAACWARLNNTDMADFELRYAIYENYAGNGFSMYTAHDLPFQIDANYGIIGAMLNMLVIDLPAIGSSASKKVVLGPAIPARWKGGKVTGLRIRGGGSVDFEWNDSGLVTSASVKGGVKGIELVDRDGKLLARS
ncbi:hypothetical protein NA57DRAFT_52502 [Rhizodiscina lignyota]|uniref:Glycoside hydrolase family 95 protein n=1 Tax=Rhizodiscina lignyota TaxID=1504668 RepID=A0A9P4IN30_9PEZI|nr:hypothetical protein NA57DRAFT_52502 [Rhizodiscina lignyota]